MAIMSGVAVDNLLQNPSLQFIAAICALLAVSRAARLPTLYNSNLTYRGQYPTVQVIYNLYFHPLSKFPGPKLWAASRLPFVCSLLTGKLVRREREFHEKYGDIIRLAPDEVSFASEEAWNDIYSFRRGHKRALRDKAYYIGNPQPVEN